MKYGFCQDCKHWWADGSCGILGSGYDAGNENSISVDVYVHDDSGLDINVKTGPLFGCRLFEK